MPFDNSAITKNQAKIDKYEFENIIFLITILFLILLPYFYLVKDAFWQLSDHKTSVRDKQGLRIQYYLPLNCPFNGFSCNIFLLMWLPFASWVILKGQAQIEKAWVLKILSSSQLSFLWILLLYFFILIRLPFDNWGITKDQAQIHKVWVFKRLFSS